ncbi:hypothetical protein WL29_22325 [Burkholderia ubonensis]|uniref:Uncharacterized protein n=1 Tax=Burkholderia ubonensis TaxID=101571 RepID=A0A119HFL7_9BURK|nr:hypothetical protein [Burkholderia ubonensis]KWA84104.1 hypothetical protein WL29_22325 [Burkholderia ubonensis]
MGDYADQSIEQYISGRRGMPIPKQREYPKTTKAAIADRLFHIVEVLPGMGMKTNRTAGMKLVVCDRDEASYWVWASQQVSGIAKDVCAVLETNLTLADALARTGRKAYGPKQSHDETNNLN